MILNVHKRGKDVVVAACDDDLLEKTFRCGELKLHVSKRFYGEETCSEGELIAALRCCTSANLVGSAVVAVAIEAGLIRRDGILYIGEVPHAQLYRVSANLL